MFLKLVAGVLDSHRFTNDGPLVRRLESELCAHFGVKHVVCVSSGTAALQVAAVAMDMPHHVLMPAATFVGTAHALRWIGRRPILVDCDGLGSIDAWRGIMRAAPKSLGIVAVHLFGIDVPTMIEAAAAHSGAPLLFDAAHAFGVKSCHGRGLASAYSFHATKAFHTFEGGCIATNDDGVAERARLGRNFGFADFDTVTALGTNAKMSELHAAAGLANLSVWDKTVGHNERLAETYAEGLSCLGTRIRALPCPPESGYFVLRVQDRDRIAAALWARGIRARRYFWPGVHRCPPYAERQPSLPMTERLFAETLALPMGPTVTTAQAAMVADVIVLEVNRQ